MIAKKPKITLYLRRERPNEDGECPIYIRFSRIDGKEVKFPLKNAYVREEDWDDDKKVRMPKDDNLAEKVGGEVLRIKMAINKAWNNYTPITKELLSDIVHENDGTPKPAEMSFYDFFDDYRNKKKKNGQMGESTDKGYETTLNSLKEFKPELTVKDFNEKFLRNFDRFLVNRGEEKGLGDVRGSRYNRLKHIRSVVYHIEKRGIKIENPFRTGDFVIPEAEVNNVFLERGEVERLNKVFTKKVRYGTEDYYSLLMFMFSCNTGLRIGDILSLRWKDIDRSAEPWVIDKIAGKKVGGKYVHLYIPISEYALLLIDWAQDEIYNSEFPDRLVFPEIPAENINRNIKKYAKPAGIDKHLTFHVSRRTYATNLVTKKTDDYRLMRLMGHTDLKPPCAIRNGAPKWLGKVLSRSKW